MSSVTDIIPLHLLQGERDKHPFSVLTEIHQRNYLDRPIVLDETRTEAGWLLTVGVNSPTLGTISVTGNGQTKAAAKTQAAASVLDQLRLRTSTGRSVSASSASSATSSSSSNSTAPSSTTASDALWLPQPDSQDSPALTRKQEALKRRNEDQLHLLQRMAVDHGTSTTTMNYVCIDVEVWEQGGRDAPLLEVGIAWMQSMASRLQVPEIHREHFIVQEHLHLHNGHYCADNRDNFNFGKSKLISEHDLGTTLIAIFGRLRSDGGKICLVGHNIKQDLDWLAGFGCALLTEGEVIVCDFGMAFQAQMDLLQASKLSKMMDHYGITYCNLHNGGNDAFYSLELFLCMLEEAQDNSWSEE